MSEDGLEEVGSLFRDLWVDSHGHGQEEVHNLVEAGGPRLVLDTWDTGTNQLKGTDYRPCLG